MEGRISELKGERDDARNAVTVGEGAHRKLEKYHRREPARHGRTKKRTFRLGPAAAVLFLLLR